MKIWLTVKDIIKLTDKHKSSILRQAKRERWTKRNFDSSGGKQYRYYLPDLPIEIQIAYIESKKTELEEVKTFLQLPREGKKVVVNRYTSHTRSNRHMKSIDQTPEHYLQVGALRSKLIKSWSESGLKVEDFIQAYSTGVACTTLKEKLGKYGDIKNPTTFYRWLRDYENRGIVGLCPQYEIHRGGNGASMDDDCKEVVKALYLDYRKPSVRSIERDIRQFGYKINYHILYRYIKDIPQSVKTFYRLGEKAYHDRFDPYISRDYTRLKSMEWGVGDHHMMDIVVLYKDKLIRPWLTRFDDMRSRYNTGWWIDAIPNSLTILRALDMTLTNCGAFANLLIDNGKDFKGQWLSGNEWKIKRYGRITEEIEPLVEGVFHDCGFNLHFCNPYHGQSKPIERAFRTDIELFEKKISTYVGSNTITRPEEAKLYWSKIGNRDKKEVFITIEQLREMYADYVKWFNSTWKHSGQGMDHKTPKQVFEENWTERRVLPDEYRKYVMTRRENHVVQRNGVTMDGLSYYTPAMAQYIGTKVQVRRGLDDISKVWIFELPKPVYLFEACCDELKDRGITEENVRQQRKLRKEARKHLNIHERQKAEAIRNIRKSPAELLAESSQADEALKAPEEQQLKVVNGEIEIPRGPVNDQTVKPTIITYPGGHSKKKRSKKPGLKGLLDD
ncbi:MAG: Mu transposase C-terminal domain-containing protein [Spirochaetales bacterium]|nr:Mu transposase C-terminal domain-containing protein [Spirochaetales bacterium]